MATDENEGSTRLQLRWFVLVLSSLATLGSYYCYDNPSALHDQFKDYFHHTSYEAHFEMYFNLLYTVYSIPNCVLPLVGGVLSDIFGIRFMLVVFASFIAFGQLICVLGIMQQSLIVVLIGRVFFGIGGESLSAVASALVSSWFAGSVLNDMLSPWLEGQFGLATALAVGFGLTIFSLICGLLLICLKGDNEQTELPLESSPPDMQVPITLPLKPSRIVNKQLSDISDHSDYSDMSDVETTVYGAIFPFNNVSSAVLRDEYGGEKAGVNVGAVQGVPFGIAAILTPIIGVLVDKYGYRVQWMVGSSLLLMIAHAIIFYGPDYSHEDNAYEAFFVDNPVPSFMFIGIGYSVVAGVVWPSSVCVVEPEKTATAFGLLTSFQKTPKLVRHRPAQLRLDEKSILLDHSDLNRIKTRLELPQYHRGASADI